MSTTTLGSARSRTGRSGGPPPARTRRPGWAVGAVLMITVGGALGGHLFQQAGAKTSVVVVVKRVSAEHIITRADLSSVGDAGGLPTIPAKDLPALVGRRAAVTLLPGTPLQPSMLTSAGAPQSGQAQVGLSLTAGQIPSEGVQPGDTVEILQLPGAGSAGDAGDPAQVLVPVASVWSARPDTARSGGFLLTVTVPAEMVADIVSASDAGHVAVVRVVADS